jgi:predicted Rossmann fold flavoprotein
VSRSSFDVIVVGGGAAGLMCALRAGQRGRRVLVLEHADKVGKKILISGGGRCNFTNLDSRPEAFLSANPHFSKSALARYTQHDFIALVDKHRIAWHEKTLSQLFCDGSARQIVAMLLVEGAAVGVEVRVSHRISAIERSDRFSVRTDKGDFEAPVVVLATGGLSIPKMGATGFTHDVARRFGLVITETRPALVPLTLAVPDLSGVSLEVVARCGRDAFREAMLFTHRGLSGPAILQISSYWREGQEIGIDLLPDFDAMTLLKDRKRERPKAELRTILAEQMPQRLPSIWRPPA